MWWFVLALLACALCGMFIWLTNQADRGGYFEARHPNLFGWIVNGCILWTVLACLIVVSPIFYEYPGVSVPVTFDGDRVIKHPYGCFEWPWQSTAVLFSESADKSLGTTFITDNSRVRKLRYRVRLEVADPVKYFRDKSRRVSWWTMANNVGISEIEKRLESQLYEFGNQYAARLVEFYNPLSQDQQASFETLVRECVDPIFAEDGVRVSSAVFEMSD